MKMKNDEIKYERWSPSDDNDFILKTTRHSRIKRLRSEIYNLCEKIVYEKTDNDLPSESDELDKHVRHIRNTLYDKILQLKEIEHDV